MLYQIKNEGVKRKQIGMINCEPLKGPIQLWPIIKNKK